MPVMHLTARVQRKHSLPSMRFTRSALTGWTRCILLVALAVVVCPARADPPPARADIPVGRPAPNELPLLERHIERGDLLSAVLLIERLRARADAATGARLGELEKRFEQLLGDQEVTRAEGYLWARKVPSNSLQWQRAIKAAEERLGTQQRVGQHAGIGVLRVRLEEADREEWIGVEGKDLDIFTVDGGGYSGHAFIRSTEFLLPGRGRSPDSGALQIESLRHASPRLPLALPDDKVTILGEVLLRRVAKENSGSIHVQVTPEPGLSLEGAVVRAGRRFAYWEGGTPTGPDGTCVITDIAAGPCEVYVEVPRRLRSPRRQLQVGAGQVSQVELKAYASRSVTIDWKYRYPAGEGGWTEGTSTVLTGMSAPLDMWGQNGGAYELSDWDGSEARISGVNGRLLPVDAGHYDPPQMGPADAQFQAAAKAGHPIAPGGVFAVRYSYLQKGEALIRIRSIEPAVPLTSRPASAPSPTCETKSESRQPRTDR